MAEQLIVDPSEVQSITVDPSEVSDVTPAKSRLEKVKDFMRGGTMEEVQNRGTFEFPPWLQNASNAAMALELAPGLIKAAPTLVKGIPSGIRTAGKVLANPKGPIQNFLRAGAEKTAEILENEGGDLANQWRPNIKPGTAKQPATRFETKPPTRPVQTAPPAPAQAVYQPPAVETPAPRPAPVWRGMPEAVPAPVSVSAPIPPPEGYVRKAPIELPFPEKPPAIAPGTYKPPVSQPKLPSKPVQKAAPAPAQAVYEPPWKQETATAPGPSVIYDEQGKPVMLVKPGEEVAGGLPETAAVAPPTNVKKAPPNFPLGWRKQVNPNTGDIETVPSTREVRGTEKQQAVKDAMKRMNEALRDKAWYAVETGLKSKDIEGIASKELDAVRLKYGLTERELKIFLKYVKEAESAK